MATFGNTGVGDTNYAPGSIVKEGSKFTLSVAAQISSITAYCKGEAGNCHLKMAIYNTSLALMGYTEEIDITTTAGWWTANATAPFNLAAGDYWIVLVGDADIRSWYNNATGNYLGIAATYASEFTDPFGAGSSGSYEWSIYATYTSTYTLTITCPTGHCTIDPAVGVHEVSTGSTLIEATGDAGYEFDHAIITETGSDPVFQEASSSASYIAMHVDGLVDTQVDIYYRPVLPTRQGFLITYFDDITDNIWKALDNTINTEITDERRGANQAAFSVPNTSNNRTILHLTSIASTNATIRIFFNGKDMADVVFFGELTGCNFSITGMITCFCYNTALRVYEQAPNVINDSYTTTAEAIINAIHTASGVENVTIGSGGAGGTAELLTPLNLTFNGEKALDAIRIVCESAGLEYWGVPDSPLTYGVLLQFGLRSATVRTPTTFLNSSAHAFDRVNQSGVIIMKGNDSSGSVIMGSAGTSGAAKVYVTTNLTDAASLGSLAAQKLLIDNNPTLSVPLYIPTNEAGTYSPGEYITVSKTNLILNDDYMIQRLTKHSDVTTVEITIASAREFSNLKEVTDQVQAQGLIWAT